ncbi:MAG: restriction endonuclease subunit S [Cellulomonas sp.]|uniref:restriction endonuclease subunit S n=1 Tax=Cellulomonas sp. TaxID=40001 RepID=UPI00184CADA6|nr:restriction endonuclease subunit S [Cellulomonas sp.]NMM29690.1 restriction endonuclease subunit S [Cellulomonas sp.]
MAEKGYGDLKPLSVYLEHGVVPRAEQTDNHNSLGADLDGYLRVLPGDVVFNKLRTWQGGLGVSRDEGIVSPAYFVCRAAARAEPRFLHHLLRSAPYLAELTRRSKWMPPSQFDISWDALRTLPLLLPPHDLQRRIADFLDDQVALLDRAIHHRHTQADLLAERRSSSLEAIFGTSQDSVLPLRRVVVKWIDYRGATPTKTSSGVPLVTAKNIRGGNVTFEASQEFIAIEDYGPWMRRGLPIRGDVLLTTEAPLGEVAQIDDTDIALAQRVILLRADQAFIHARWLYWYLRSPQGQSELWQRATGTTAQGIKAERLRELPIPIPSREEQLRLMRDAERAESAWQESVPLLNRSAALMGERRQALITAAVTGQFDVTTARSVA